MKSNSDKEKSVYYNPLEWARDEAKWQKANEHFDTAISKLMGLKKYTLELLENGCCNFGDNEAFYNSYNHITTTNIHRHTWWEYSKNGREGTFFCKYNISKSVNNPEINITVKRAYKAKYYRKVKEWGYDFLKLTQKEKLELIVKHTQLLCFICENIGRFKTMKGLYKLEVDLLRANTAHWGVKDNIVSLDYLPSVTQYKIAFERVVKDKRRLIELLKHHEYIAGLIKLERPNIKKHGLDKKISEYISDALQTRGIEIDSYYIAKQLSSYKNKKPK